MPAVVPSPETTPGLRHRICQVAHDHFMAHGFSRFTMDDLAADLGMSKKTLYRHFRSKEQLLNSVLDLRLDSIEKQLTAVAEDGTLDFNGRMATSLEVLGRRLGEVKPPFMQDLRRHAPESFQRIERFRERYVSSYFGKLLADGRSEGMIRSDLDDRIVIDALLQLVQRLVNPEAVLRYEVSLARVFNTVLTLMLEGVLTARGRNALHRRNRLLQPARQ